jgi:PIN domain nuclease of toxin-antitoxin system
LLVSAVTAWEYADLHHRGRLPAAADFDTVATALSLEIIDLPAGIWRLATTLPDLHRDPVDRILIAHAIDLDATLMTADATMRRYPVRCLW